MNMTARVAARAVEIQPARVALTILAAPFYALGFLVGLLWVAIAWSCAAVALGVADVRASRGGRGET